MTQGPARGGTSKSVGCGEEPSSVSSDFKRHNIFTNCCRGFSARSGEAFLDFPILRKIVVPGGSPGSGLGAAGGA